MIKKVTKAINIKARMPIVLNDLFNENAENIEGFCFIEEYVKKAKKNNKLKPKNCSQNPTSMKNPLE